MTGLSDAQLDIVLQQGSFLARACPGAGKTRTIVHRLQHRSREEARRGIGLVSFTNAAVDEMRARCTHDPAALAAPNFIGTFDSFINRFITTPLYVSEHGDLPSYTETWGELPFGRFEIRGRSFPLDWFDFDQEYNDKATLIEQRIPRAERGKLAEIIADPDTHLCARARGMYRALRRAHCLSSTTSRAMALRWCAEPETRSALKRLLSARFAEIIVDEAQDCGLEELQLMELLREAGVALVLVADIDQSIYGFRRATPEEVTAFATKLGNEMRLDGNYRSTPAICGLNQSLRHRRRGDTPVGPNKESDVKVRLMAYQKLNDIAPEARRIADENGLQEHEVAVLAYMSEHARKAAGAPEEPGGSSSTVLRIVEAHNILTGASDPKSRRLALRAVEWFLLRAFTSDENWGQASLEELCQLHGIDRAQLRAAAVQLATAADPAERTAKSYAELLRNQVSQLPWASTIGRPDTSALRAPTAEKWKLALAAAVPGRFAWNTIHSVKGLEYPGVVVVIPKDLRTDAEGLTVLDHWQHDHPSEARRVLYVGASRAQRLAILACHASRVTQVRTILEATHVDYTDGLSGVSTLF